MTWIDNKKHEVVTLVASAAQTATSTGEAAVRIPRGVNGIAFTLDVTAAATDAGDTLNLQVQTKLDGTNWVDVVWFTEVLGNGSAKRYIEKITASGAEAGFETGTALSAGEVRNLIGDEFRVAWQVVDAGTDNASFTFSVTGCPM